MWPFDRQRKEIPREPCSIDLLAYPIFSFRCKCGSIVQVNLCESLAVNQDHLQVTQPIRVSCDKCSQKYKSKYATVNESLELIRSIRFEVDE